MVTDLSSLEKMKSISNLVLTSVYSLLGVKKAKIKRGIVVFKEIQFEIQVEILLVKKQKTHLR